MLADLGAPGDADRGGDGRGAADGTIRRLTEADRGQVLALIDQDPIMGSLVHSFIVRRGLEGSQEFWGLLRRETDGARAAVAERLAGLFTLDPDGRSTVLGGGPADAGRIAAFMRGRVAGGAQLAFIDAPRELAVALADVLPPTAIESLGVWAYSGPAPSPLRQPPAGITAIRPVAPLSDGAGLQALYEADDTFRELGVNIGDAMDAVRRDLRLMLVGTGPAGEIVAAAFGWLTDAAVARVAGVVTHPAWRGRGFATALVGELTRLLLAGGRQPFLYVSLGNAAAVSVYERLGYRPHAVVDKLRYGAGRY